MIVLFALSFTELKPPFEETSIREINGWNLIGNSVRTKSKIYLTSGLQGKSGGLCGSVMTTEVNWTLDLEVELKDAKLTFLFTRSMYTGRSEEKLIGMKVFFTSNHTNTEIRIEGEDVLSRVSCCFNEELQYITIKKIGRNFTVTSNHQTCSAVTYQSSGYIGFIGENNANCQECSAVVKSLTSSSNTTLRRSARSNARIMHKMMRRANMLTVSRYLKNESTHFDLKDALFEIQEMVTRSRQCVPTDNLSQFLSSRIDPVFSKATDRFERVSSALWHMKDEMRQYWQTIQSQLLLMKGDVQRMCRELEDDTQKLSYQIQGKATPILPSSQFNSILFIICLIELIFYVVFAFRYHKYLKRKKLL